NVWLRELTTEGKMIALVIRLVDAGKVLEISTGLQDALLEHAKGVIGGQERPEAYQEEWGELLDALKEESRETLLRDLRDELLRNSDKSLAVLLILYGHTVLEGDLLEEKADEVTRLLFKGIIERKDAKELMWLKKALEEKQNILERAQRASKKVFHERITNELSEGVLSDEARECLEDIAELLGLEFERKESEVQPTSEEERENS
ncbi:MAG: hypothetical protein ACE5JS_22495, partial [Nitrospinota bacterium]